MYGWHDVIFLYYVYVGVKKEEEENRDVYTKREKKENAFFSIFLFHC